MGETYNDEAGQILPHGKVGALVPAARTPNKAVVQAAQDKVGSKEHQETAMW